MKDCSCSPLKKNITQGSIYSVIKTGMGPKKIYKKGILYDFLLVSSSGLVYDMFIEEIIKKKYKYDKKDEMVIPEEYMYLLPMYIKLLVQLGTLIASDVFMKRKIKFKKVMSDLLSLSISGPGIKYLDKYK